MTELRLFWWRSLRMLQYAVFIFILKRALSNASQPTVSYTFRISCRTNQSCLSSDCCTSSIMFLIIEIGQWVDVPLRTEQLLPLRMSPFLHTSSILLVRILVKTFLVVSSRVI